METLKRGICTTCHFQRGCSLKTTGSPSWDCSEYTENRVFASPAAQLYAVSAPVQASTTVKGLCADCESLPSCTWFQSHAVIVRCEHYQ